VQVKLLRYLQEQRFTRVGGRQELEGDARVIAATNANLEQEITTGKFREDLYFRLAVVVIKLPPLRERADDTVLLAREFLQRYGVQNDRPNLSFSPGALRALNTHPWPGNVRELQNRVKRAVIMADGKRITEKDLELTGAGGLSRATLKEVRESVERDLVQQALKRHFGKISSAAAELGISRPTFYELMEKLGVDRGAAKAE
jgi:two-component system NtrC family response regulator